VVVGGDEVSYGSPPPPQSTYRAQMLEEVGAKIDPDRVHFTGLIDYRSYLSLLQVSSAHAYLTYPFVLSWSFIEAMASGCLVVGSETPPVLEVLRDRVNGLTVDFFSPAALADSVESALEQPEKMQKLRAAARDTAVKGYDLKKVLIPRWVQLFNTLVS
jgi:glycosyltransferase involved in cell wall biosynthesis